MPRLTNSYLSAALRTSYLGVACKGQARWPVFLRVRLAIILFLPWIYREGLFIYLFFNWLVGRNQGESFHGILERFGIDDKIDRWTFEELSTFFLISYQNIDY